MNNIALVQKLQCAQCVVNYNFEVFFIKTTFGAEVNQALQVRLESFHYYEQVLHLSGLEFLLRDQKVNQLGKVGLHARNFSLHEASHDLGLSD